MPRHQSKRTIPTTMPSHQQNLELFKLLETAKFHLAELNGNPGAHPGELHHWEKEFDCARTQLILANQGLVGSIAGKYESIGLEFNELMSVGNVGLMKAIEKFDASRGTKFSTFACWSIKGAITRALSSQIRTIRVPEYQLAALSALKKTMERLSIECGYEPSVEELAWATNIPVRKVRSLLAMENLTVSIDTEKGGEEGATIIDFIADTSAVDPSHGADTSMCNELIKNAMATLKESEREVIVRRYGLKDGRPCSLEAIALEVGVSSERIRQIQDEAEAKMRRFRQARDFNALVKAAMHGNKITALAVVKSPASVAASNVCRLKTRGAGKNENHHIWNNNGTWFCKFRVTTADGRIKKMKESLKTKRVEEARIRRDEMMAAYNEPIHHAAA
jgi:RNA polymerase sigma factor (sigma-70 family)